MAHFEDQKNLRKIGSNYHPSIGTGPIADPYSAPLINFCSNATDFQDAEAEAWHEGHESFHLRAFEPPFLEEDFSASNLIF